MKKLALGLALLAAGALVAGAASAHGRVRLGVGFHFGPYWGSPWGPAWGPAWGPWYPAYYPPAVIVASPPAPVQYIERNDQPLQSGYWYYCETSRGYYPYVKECSSGWKAVPPAPPPAQ
jgi:hypothetical protein